MPDAMSHEFHQSTTAKTRETTSDCLLGENAGKTKISLKYAQCWKDENLTKIRKRYKDRNIAKIQKMLERRKSY